MPRNNPMCYLLTGTEKQLQLNDHYYNQIKNSISKHTNTDMIGTEEGLKKCLGVMRQKGKKIRHRAVHISVRCKGMKNMVFWIKILVKDLYIAIDLQTMAKSIIQNIQQRGWWGEEKRHLAFVVCVFYMPSAGLVVLY